LDPRFTAVDSRHLEFPAERRSHHGDRHTAVQIGSIALKELVRDEGKENVEIARRAAAQAGLAFAGKPYTGAVLDAGRDVDRKISLARHPSGADAARARIVDHLAAALAGRAGALQREETLRMAHPAYAPAGGAGFRLGAGLGARAGAGFACDRSRDANLRGFAFVRFFERDLHVVAKIGAALAARGAAGAAARHAEDAFEDVCECGAEIGAEAVAATHAAMFKSGVTEAVISGTLVAVLEDVVGLVDFLEAVLAVLIARIAVGVMLHRELAERCLQLDFRAGAFDAQDLVVVALGHAALILVPHVIMAGLNPAIHLFRRLTKERWTPGSSPGVTISGRRCVQR